MKKTVDQFRSLKYTTVVFLDATTADTPCYIALHPELPGCITQGETPEEAIENLKEARDLIIEHLLNNDLPVPVPQYLWSRGRRKRTLSQTGIYDAPLSTPQPMGGTFTEKLVLQTDNYTAVRSEYKAPAAEFVLA